MTRKLKVRRRKRLTSLIALLAVFPSLVLAQAQDPGWPRLAEKDGARMVYYQPQVDEWKDHRELHGDMAVSVTGPKGKAAIGVVSLAAQTQTDVEARTVVLSEITVTSTRFQGLDPAEAERINSLVRELAPKGPTVISLDRLLATLEPKQEEVRSIPGASDPPTIFVSTRPAILLFVDGDPIRAPIEGTNLDFVVNTSWLLAFDRSTSAHYLLVDGSWLTAAGLEGPWSATTKLPPDFTALAAKPEFADVKQSLPARPPKGPVPEVFFTKRPAELILFAGAPLYAPVAGTALVYATNTESPVFLQNIERQFYYLVAGRWFRATTLDGPWSYANDDLPADFAKIPPNSAAGWVRASVPGTQEAEDAVLLAAVPTTTVVDRATAETDANVTYDGAPQFEPIEGTSLQYAGNTPEKVIQVNNEYYLCQNAVWFKSSAPAGPWKCADSVPPAVYKIPPSSPVYNVTYVYPSNPTAATVQSNQTAGYLGAFVLGGLLGGVIGYGLGNDNNYYPHPYVYYPPGRPYPVYRPVPYTYGCGAIYNPYTGAYGVGRKAYGPYGSAGSAVLYNPATGTYGRAATVQTAYGSRTAAAAYNPWTGASATTRQGSNAYGQAGTTTVQKGGQWAQAGHVTTAQGSAGAVRTSEGKYAYGRSGEQGKVVKTNQDLYASKDGSVYRRDSSGSWQKYEGGSWSTVEKPPASKPKSASTTNAQQARQGKSSGTTAQSASTTSTQKSRQGSPSSPRPSSAKRPTTTAASSGTMESLDRQAQGRQRGARESASFEQYQRSGRSGGGRARAR
jgi:hypothetical protein